MSAKDFMTDKDLIDLIAHSARLSAYVKDLTEANQKIISQNTRLKQQNRELQKELKVLKTAMED